MPIFTCVKWKKTVGTKKLENRYIFISSWVGENLRIKISARNINNMGKNHKVFRVDIYKVTQHKKKCSMLPESQAKILIWQKFYLLECWEEVEYK